MSEPGANPRHRQGKRAARPKPEADQPKAETERTWPTYRPLESDDAGPTTSPRSTPPASRSSQTEQTPWFTDAPAFKHEQAAPRTDASPTRYEQQPARSTQARSTQGRSTQGRSTQGRPKQPEAGSRYEQPATRLSQTPLRSEPSRPIPTPLDAQPRRVGTPPEVGRPESRGTGQGARAAAGTSASSVAGSPVAGLSVAGSSGPGSSAEGGGAAGTSGPDARAAGTSGLTADPRAASGTGRTGVGAAAGSSGLDASRSDGQTERYSQNAFFNRPEPGFRQEPHAQQAGAPAGDRRGRADSDKRAGSEARVGSEGRAGAAPVRMSDPGARARRDGSGGGGDESSRSRSKQDGREPRSRARRSAFAALAVLLVGGPITWLLLHQPNGNLADGSIPFMDREDDTYVTPSAKPAGSTTKPSAKASTPPVPTTNPTTTPSGTPTETPSSSTPPTSNPTQKGTATTIPTNAPSTRPTVTNNPTVPVETPSGGPTKRPTQQPTNKPTETPPPSKPPARDGGMEPQELQLFDLIDDARQDKGCKPLEQDPGVTEGARSEAEERAEEDNVNGSGSSKAAAGGDDWSAREAFDQMMSKNSSTILNCNLTTLGVGADGHRYCTSVNVLGACLGPRKNRVAWVADFT